MAAPASDFYGSNGIFYAAADFSAAMGAAVARYAMITFGPDDHLRAAAPFLAPARSPAGQPLRHLPCGLAIQQLNVHCAGMPREASTGLA
jgi:hypothetical protein